MFRSIGFAASFVIATLLSLSPWSSARAFVLEPRAMACMLYFRSDAVFTGEVVSSKEIYGMEEGEDSLLGWTYTLKIIKSYLGVSTTTIEVFTPADSSSLHLNIGKKYLLFATKESGRLTIGYDRVSGELKDAKVQLQDLERIMARQPGQGGDVFIRVVSGPFNDQEGGLGGIHVLVKGPAGSAKSISNDKGWLRVHVPIGTYSATASGAGWSFVSQDISWQNSDSFTVPDGGCAEIQIQANSLTSK